VNYLFAFDDYNYLQADVGVLLPMFQTFCEKNNIRVSIDEIQSYVNKLKEGVWFVNNISGALHVEMNSTNKYIEVTTPNVTFNDPFENVNIYDNPGVNPKPITETIIELSANTGWGTKKNPLYAPITTQDVDVLGLPNSMGYELVTNPLATEISYGVRVFVKPG
jgi:hypothetical protein